MAPLAIYKKGRTPPYLNPHISQVRVLVVQRKMRGLQIGMFALRHVRSVLVVGPLLEIGKTSLLMSSWMIHQLGVETVGRLGRTQNRELYSRYVMEHAVIERVAFATTVLVVVVVVETIAVALKRKKCRSA